MLWHMADEATNWNGKHDGKFFEEFIELLPSGEAKCHGVRVIDSPQGRKLGIAGRSDMTLIAPIKLLRCFKEIEIKASLKNPRRIFTTLQRLEGNR
jgi:hypothetical protein